MSEETLEKPIEAPIPDSPPKELSPEQQAFQQCQREYMELCAAAGEKQYVIDTTRKELRKLNIRLRKVNKKSYAIMQSLQAKNAAKADAPDLKVVPNPQPFPV